MCATLALSMAHPPWANAAATQSAEPLGHLHGFSRPMHGEGRAVGRNHCDERMGRVIPNVGIPGVHAVMVVVQRMQFIRAGREERLEQ